MKGDSIDIDPLSDMIENVQRFVSPERVDWMEHSTIGNCSTSEFNKYN